jgi:hypothetical protein
MLIMQCIEKLCKFVAIICRSSAVGSMEINETHLINYSIYNKGGQTFECFDQSGTYYAFK